jgi:eukaryotic-like serine/threonine-protein kinase
MGQKPTYNTFAAGQEIAGHLVTGLLGRGGMGEVYEVYHEEIGDYFALKLLSEEMMEYEDSVPRFQREAEVMAALDHPHIAKVFAWGEADGRHWLRMELLGGLQFNDDGPVISTLEEFIEDRGGRLPQEEVRECMRQFLEGIHYAHGKGVIHRDLKPANILLYKDGMKIVDFGIVDAVGSEWVQTLVTTTVAATVAQVDAPTVLDTTSAGDRSPANSLLGTYAYMSPEQKEGWVATVQSDLYSIGLICFNMLTGEQELGFHLPSKICTELESSWDEFIEKALEENPEKRFKTAEEMLYALPFINPVPDSFSLPMENQPSRDQQSVAPWSKKLIPQEVSGSQGRKAIHKRINKHASGERSPGPDQPFAPIPSTPQKQAIPKSVTQQEDGRRVVVMQKQGDLVPTLFVGAFIILLLFIIVILDLRTGEEKSILLNIVKALK